MMMMIYWPQTQSTYFFFYFCSPDTWKDKDESKNKVQNFDKDIILSQKRGEVEDEIRHRVDAQMREELDLLKIVSKRIIFYYSVA